jgi:hypothetical protein
MYDPHFLAKGAYTRTREPYIRREFYGTTIECENELTRKLRFGDSQTKNQHKKWQVVAEPLLQGRNAVV